MLSLGLPFALVSLVHFTSRPDVMGILVNRRTTTAAAVAATAAIVVLNGYLVFRILSG